MHIKFHGRSQICDRPCALILVNVNVGSAEGYAEQIQQKHDEVDQSARCNECGQRDCHDSDRQ